MLPPNLLKKHEKGMVCLDMSPTENVGDVPFISDICKDKITAIMGSNTSKKASSYNGSNQETQIFQKKDPLISVIKTLTTDYTAATPTASLTPLS